MAAPRRCKECEPGSKRPAPFPGPRCSTHHRATSSARAEAAWGRALMEKYGITPEEYWAIYEEQGGRCYICRRATGATKRLAVDHDHGKRGRASVRGLLDSLCNRGVLGHLRDERDALLRAVEYLDDPPAQRVLRRLHGPDGGPPGLRSVS